jgi:hypothetical protein
VIQIDTFKTHTLSESFKQRYISQTGVISKVWRWKCLPLRADHSSNLFLLLRRGYKPHSDPFDYARVYQKFVYKHETEMSMALLFTYVHSGNTIKEDLSNKKWPLVLT